MKNILLLFINGIYDEKFHLVISDEYSNRIKNKNIILAQLTCVNEISISNFKRN